MPSQTLLDGSASISDDLSFKLSNGIEVELSSQYISSDGSYNLVSTSKNSNSSNCTITISNLNPTGTLEFSQGMLGIMAKNLQYGSGDEFWGRTYFGDLFNFDGIPKFHGVVESASKLASIRTNGDLGDDVYGWGGHIFSYGLTYNQIVALDKHNNKTTWNFRNSEKFSPYQTGLWDKSTEEQAILAESFDNTMDRMTEIFNPDFDPENPNSSPTGNYKQGSPKIQLSSTTHDWFFLSDPAKESDRNSEGIKEITIGYGATDIKNVTVVVEKDSIKFKYTTGLNNNKKENFSLTQYNTILVPTLKDNNQVVKIHGEITNSFTMATKSNSVVIDNDLYYSSLSDFKNIARNTINNAKMKQIKRKMPSSDLYCGIIAGADLTTNANIEIHKDAGDNNNSVLISAALYAPNGKFGTHNILDEDNNGNYIWPDQRFIGVINIGSVIFNTKGIYRSGGRGMYSYLNSDNRFVKGKTPFGFILGQVQDTATGEWGNRLGSDMIWSVSYSSCSD